MGRSQGKWFGSWAMAIGLLVVLAGPGATASAREWKTYENTKYGYSLKIPAEFKLESEDKSTSWIFQPGSAPGADKATKKKKGINIGARIKGIDIGASQSEETASGSSGGGGLESALSIHVNWAWMPDVSSDTLYRQYGLGEEGHELAGSVVPIRLSSPGNWLCARGERVLVQGSGQGRRRRDPPLAYWRVWQQEQLWRDLGGTLQFKEWGPVFDSCEELAHSYQGIAEPIPECPGSKYCACRRLLLALASPLSGWPETPRGHLSATTCRQSVARATGTGARPFLRAPGAVRRQGAGQPGAEDAARAAEHLFRQEEAVSVLTRIRDRASPAGGGRGAGGADPGDTGVAVLRRSGQRRGSRRRRRTWRWTCPRAVPPEGAGDCRVYGSVAGGRVTGRSRV